MHSKSANDQKIGIPHGLEVSYGRSKKAQVTRPMVVFME